MKNKSASDRQSRKRELDRKAQRSARERAKSRMAHLETLVAHFQETDSDVRFSSLTDRLSEAIDERDNLRSLLESVNFAIRSHLDKTPVNKGLSSSSTACRDSSGQSLQSGPGVPDSQEANNLASCRLLTETLGGPDANDGDIALYSSGSLQANPLLFGLSPLPAGFISTDGSIVSQAVPPECECMLGTAENTAITLSIWRELNELFKSLPEADLAAEDQEGEHVIIRAVLEGWDKIGETGQLSTTCRKLRRLDELVWVHCNPADRLAILSLIHLMVVSQNSAGQTELPRWLQARPSQRLPHATAIDFIFWPGVRERLVFSEHEYCANSFWRCAFSSTRLAWPFDLRDAYVRNSLTGKLHLSPYFRISIRDLSNWTMSPEFLNQYPELRDDIEGYSAPPLV